MEKQITIIFNGQRYRCSKSITLLNLLDYFNYTPSLLVIEYNKVICTTENWGKTYLKHNDKIEVVSIVGGG